MKIVIVVIICALLITGSWLAADCRELRKELSKRNEGLCHKCEHCGRFDGVRVYCEKTRGLYADTCMLGEVLTCKDYKEK